MDWQMLKKLKKKDYLVFGRDISTFNAVKLHLKKETGLIKDQSQHNGKWDIIDALVKAVFLQ